MDTQNQNEQREAVVDNWAALESDHLFNDVVETKSDIDQEETKETTDENQEEKDTNKESKTETQEDEAPEGEKTDGEDQKSESEETVKEEDATTDLVEFKAEDIEGFEQEPEDGTWLAVAKATGLEIKEDSFEAYNEAVQNRIKEVEEKAKSITKESIYAELDPQQAMVLKLMDMGVSLEEAVAPTRMIDTYLGMEDAQLVRENLKSLKWDDEKIDTELEMLAEKGWLSHEASKIREILNVERQNVVDRNRSILENYEQNKQQVALRQKQEEVVQFQKTLDTVSKFMNVPISSDAKKAITEKFNRGDYDQILNSPQSKVELLLYKELGNKAIKHIENTAYQRGREEKTKSLLNIPPVKANTGKAVVQNNQINNWDAIEEDFGDKK